MAHHRNWRCAGSIIVWSKHASGICSDPEHGEVITGYILAGVALGRLRMTRAPDSKQSPASRECCQFRKTFRVIPKVLIQIVRDKRKLFPLAVPALITATGF